MPKFIFSYPDGLQGVALLILRLSHAPAVTAIFWALGGGPLFSSLAMLSGTIVAVQLVAGLGTRFAALLFACAAAWCAATVQGGSALLFIGLAGSGATIALLGPGAWSLDARLFGRRVIHLGGPPDRG